METLTTTFDDKRYPFKYLLKAPLSGAGAFAKRLAGAAENLGFDMPMARQFVEDYDAQGGSASYHLFAVALTQKDQYPHLLDELDRDCCINLPRLDAVECLRSRGLKQPRDELDFRKDTWLFVVDVTAFDASYCFYSAQGRLS